MAFTRFTKSVLNVSALPDRVQNQAQTLKAIFDQAGVDIKAALNALIVELEASTSADNIGADVQSVATKTVQAILTAFEEEIANRYTKTEAETLLATGTNDLVADVDVNLTTGVITVTKKDGTVETVDTAIEKVPAKFEIVESGDTFALKITNVDGTSTQTDITNFMNIYNFNNSDYITFEVTGEGTEKTVTANIKANSIGLDKLSLSVVSTLEGYMTSAKDSATAAKTSETNARTSELNALEAKNTAVNKAAEATASANAAKTSETNAEYWAKQAETNGGGGGITEIPIASAETLGGIKVGEGLEITEDGILSSLMSDGSYVEKELLSAPVQYGFTSATTSGAGVKLIEQDLALTGNIADFDELVIKAYRKSTDQTLLRMTELRIITSDIVYNNSNQRILTDGSYIPLTLVPSNACYVCHVWFKNQSTIRIYQTETTLVDSEIQRYTFQIYSIKGIKFDVKVLDGSVNVDDTPTEGSENVVTSGGVKEYVDTQLETKATVTYGTTDLTPGTSSLATGTIYLCHE